MLSQFISPCDIIDGQKTNKPGQMPLNEAAKLTFTLSWNQFNIAFMGEKKH